MRIRFVAMAVLMAVGATACKTKTKEEKLQAAEDDARFKAEEKSRMVKGVGDALQGAGKEGARSLTKGLGDVVRGGAKGVDASLTAVTVALAPGTAELGVNCDRAARRDLPSERGRAPQRAITAYLLYDRDFSGTLVLRALDDQGKEVGRTRVKVAQQKGDAGYLDFPFDARVPLATIDSFELAALP